MNQSEFDMRAELLLNLDESVETQQKWMINTTGCGDRFVGLVEHVYMGRDLDEPMYRTGEVTNG